MTPTDAVRQFNNYAFDDDSHFQDGLRDILLSLAGKPDEEKEIIVGRAKAFYFSKTTGIQVSWEDIQSIQLPSDSSYLIGNYNAVEVESTATNSGANNERAPLTFAELTALIQSGQTDQIPNNEQIPEGTNETSPSISQAAARKKPWEV